MNTLNRLIEIQARHQEINTELRLTGIAGGQEWLNLMDELGFTAGDQLKPIGEIIAIASKLDRSQAAFALEACFCDLFKIAVDAGLINGEGK